MAAPIAPDTPEIGGKPITSGQRPGHQSAVEMLSKRWAGPEVDVTPPPPEEAAPEEEIPVAAEVEPETEEALVEVGEDGEPVVPEEAAEEVAEEAEQEPAKSEEESWKDLAEVIEAAGVDPKELPVTVRSNGEDIQTTLHEALEGYQREADYTRRRQELETERDEVLTGQREQLDKLVSSNLQLQTAANVITEIMDADTEHVNTMYGAVDWEALRAEDKAEYSARRADYNASLQQVEQRRETVLGRINGAIQEAGKAAEEARTLYRNEQYKLLIKRVPGWSDVETQKKEAGEVTAYLRSDYGTTDKELRALMDHRILDMARKAMLFDRLQEKGKKISKEIKKTATKKLVRPGASKMAPKRLRQPSTAGVDKAAAVLKKSGNQRDAEEVLRQRWG